MNSIGFFWDRFGDDVYDTTTFNWLTKFDRPFGTAVERPPMGNRRDEIASIGLFLDTEGHDIYNIDPDTIENLLPLCSDESEWSHNDGPVFWSFGLDTDWY